MASITGGHADKLGNEFERLWTVRQLLRVISGQSVNVRIEPLGADSHGTEFWVANPDQTREAHQCKRENGTAGRWSIADLHEERVLEYAKFQLARDSSYRFVFASSDKVPFLADFAERARQFSDQTEFYSKSVPTSAQHKREFAALCRYLNYDPETASGLNSIVDFLKRFDCFVVDKLRQRNEVEAHAANLVTGGEPARVVEALETLILASAGKVLGEAEIIQYLCGSGFRRSDLARDPTLSQQIIRLRERFVRRFHHRLISGIPLKREETTQLSELLTKTEGPQVVLLHGSGGDGKSGVVYELIELLTTNKIPCLPLSLDYDKPADSPFKYGMMLELPASPTICLANLAAQEPAVLILDQADAIRWTASHSSYAWDTCLCLIDEAQQYSNVRVVLVCRTFDLQDDPSISAWRKERQPHEIKVKPLGEATRDDFLKTIGVNPSSLEKGQLEVLRSPQALFIWHKLRTETALSPTFRNMTGLMRGFWEMVRRHQLPRLKTGDYERVLDEIVAYADANGVLYALRSAVAHGSDELAALVSLNLLAEPHNGRYFFPHQSYLDYLTAERRLRELHAGNKDIRAWLNQHDQSLFRRGQLRQLLVLLQDEDTDKYAQLIRELLTTTGFRFHLQQLTLQVIGDSTHPRDAEVDLVVDLVSDPEWIEHVFGRVLAGREQWFDALYQRGILTHWLNSGTDALASVALNLIERVVSTRGREAEQLILAARRPARMRWIQAILLRSNPATIPDGLFDAYCAIIRSKAPESTFIDWKQLATTNPPRCLKLLQVCMRNDLASLHSPLKSFLDRQDRLLSTGEVMQSLLHVASLEPELTWELLIPWLRITLSKSRELARRHRKWLSDTSTDTSADVSDMLLQPDRNSRKHLARLRTLSSVLLIRAGRTVANRSPERFWAIAHALGRGRSRCLSRIVSLSFCQLPTSWADDVLEWLVSDPIRISCGGVQKTPRRCAGRYVPARKLIRRFSPHCSQSTFDNLERLILQHSPPHEADAFRRSHAYFMGTSVFGKATKGYLQSRDLFLGQYLLLAAISKRRLRPNVRDWLGVLRRKFGNTERIVKELPTSWGGTVVSPIPHDRLHLVSDQEWVRIVQRDWSGYHSRWNLRRGNTFIEARPESFASDLSLLARCDPSRGCRLLRVFPQDVADVYLSAIFRTFAELSPPQNTPLPDQWAPATVGEIETVIEHFQARLMSRTFAGALTWVVSKRPAEQWSDGTLKHLVALATKHPDPTSGNDDMDPSGKDDSDHILSQALNCVRGEAASAVGAILFEHPEHFAILSPALVSLTRDSHPAVRVAAIGASIPVINVDRDLAVQTFLDAVDHPDGRVLRSHDIDSFLRHTVLRYLDKLRPILIQMAHSEIPAVAQNGAGWITSVKVYSGKLNDVYRECISSPRPRVRQGVIECIAAQFGEGRYDSDGVQQISAAFSDPDEEVRKAASLVFRSTAAFGQPEAVSLLEQFAESAAFSKNAGSVMHRLPDVTTSLRPFAKAMIRMLERLSEEQGVPGHFFHADRLASALLRLYEQSENSPKTRALCLDAFDLMLKSRIGYELLVKIDG